MAVVGVSLSNDRNPANAVFQKLLLRYPVEVFAVNAKGEARAYRTSKARCYGISDLEAPRDIPTLLRQLNDELANKPECAIAKRVPQVLNNDKGDVVEAILEGSPGCYWKLFGGRWVWVCE